MNQELLRIIENVARDKNIDKESIFTDLEESMVSAIRKHFGTPESEITVQIDRASGQVAAFMDKQPIDMKQLGRIPAQTAKQVMIQRLKADERDSIYSEFAQRKGDIINGAVVRYEGGSLVVGLDHRTEAFMPKGEQIVGQTSRPGERIRCLILEVKEVSNQIKIILSRTHPDFIRRLFEQEVPEIAEEIIEIRALAREAGYRTKVAVASLDEKVDPVGACVGVRGSRIKSIVDELGGEKIDIVRWSDSSQVFITNSLMPAKTSEIALCFELGRATVVVEEDQLSLAIGRHGQNVRLAARLTGWDIDILTPDEYNQGIERLTKCTKSIEGADETLVDKLIALGIISILDLDDVGAEPLVTELNIKPDLAQRLIKAAVEEAKNMTADAKQKQADELLLKEQAQQKQAEELVQEQSQPTQAEELLQEQPQPKQPEELIQEQPQPNQAEGLIQEQSQPDQPADSTNQT